MIDPNLVSIEFKGIKFSGYMEVSEPPHCVECGANMADLGEFDAKHSGTMSCSRVIAYGFELARRGDRRPVDHKLMREDGAGLLLA